MERRKRINLGYAQAVLELMVEAEQEDMETVGYITEECQWYIEWCYARLSKYCTEAQK